MTFLTFSLPLRVFCTVGLRNKRKNKPSSLQSGRSQITADQSKRKNKGPGEDVSLAPSAPDKINSSQGTRRSRELPPRCPTGMGAAEGAAATLLTSPLINPHSPGASADPGAQRTGEAPEPRPLHRTPAADTGTGGSGRAPGRLPAARAHATEQNYAQEGQRNSFLCY